MEATDCLPVCKPIPTSVVPMIAAFPLPSHQLPKILGVHQGVVVKFQAVAVCVTEQYVGGMLVFAAAFDPVKTPCVAYSMMVAECTLDSKLKVSFTILSNTL